MLSSLLLSVLRKRKYFLRFRFRLRIQTIKSSYQKNVWKKSCLFTSNSKQYFPVLWIRDVYPGSEFFPFRIRIKEFKYFNPKKNGF
jgi:hypothetical protein